MSRLAYSALDAQSDMAGLFKIEVKMNQELAEKLVSRWNSPNGRPLSGKLIDLSKTPDQPDCMCAQGWVLFEGGMTACEISKIDQSKADAEVAKRLGISRAHGVLLRKINDSRSDSPSIVLTDPSAVLGDQADLILKFWHHLDSMDANAWIKIDAAWDAARVAGWAAARDAAEDAAGDAAGAAAWATSEIQGAAVMRERGTPFFFLPMFGFNRPESLSVS